MAIPSQTLVLDAPELPVTEAIGRRLGAELFAGAVVALIGPLGAGKTHLTRAIAEGLGISNSRVVTSPTFVLIQEYLARLPLFHFDVYRLTGPADLYDLGFHEYLEGGGVTLVEWADRVEECLPAEHLRVSMEITGPTSRRLSIEGRGQRYIDMLPRLTSL
jgi:tRNA threonylcarbamoyladenosine biosynthesis protein TsaE